MSGVLVPMWSALQPVSGASPTASPTPVGSIDFSRPSPAGSPADRNDRPLHAPGQLIVKFKPTTSAAAMAEAAVKASGSVVKRLPLPGYALVSLPTDKDPGVSAATLHQDPRIEEVEPNAYRYADFIPSDPLHPLQWHFPQIQMPQAWDLSTGWDVIVAVVDTGVAYENNGGYLQAPDLASTRFVAGWDFVNDDDHPNDDQGHGTHVAGTIAQSTNNGLGVAGVAYGAKIMPVKVLDVNGSGTAADVAQGIIWAADNGAKVINLSLGSTTETLFERDAVDYANSKGAVVVAASGNNGASSVGYPAAYPNAIAVGATGYDRTRAYYSNYGSELDLMAPGGDCRYDLDLNGDGYVDGVLQQTFESGTPTIFGYYFACGTSMAAPHVSGVVALLLARNPSMTPDQVRRAMQVTATDLGASGWDNLNGCGLVQAYDALRHPLAAPSAIGSSMASIAPTSSLSYAIAPGRTSSALSSTQPMTIFKPSLPVVFQSALDVCGSFG